MLDRLTQICLERRLIVVAAAVVLLVTGLFIGAGMKIDVFPDLTAPTVTIMTDAHGMAPEEVESLVTFPIESAINGAAGVRRLRSSSTHGSSTVYAEFEWGTDIYRARQIVNEKLQLLSGTLPQDMVPTLAPISSIMGEMMYIGLQSDHHNLMEVKETADFVVRKRVLSVPGVAQVVSGGGDVKQYQVQIDPHKLLAYGISLSDVVMAVKGSNENFSAGVMKSSAQDYLIRGIGRLKSTDEIGAVSVAVRDGTPILVRDVATVAIAPAYRIGDSSVDGKPAVVLAVLKSPEANTVELTRRLDKTLAEVTKTLPEGMKLDPHIFRQADFIQRSIDNVKRVVMEGGILVVAIIMLFLGNVRATAISVAAIPMSLIFSVFVLKYFDITINTMTLGGIAIAVGIIVDDAIIYVENVWRRLLENHARPEDQRHRSLKVIYDASREIRGPIINATLIIIVVFVPFFFLSGIEGRLLKPLGVSYIVSIAASLIVALTLTPAMCAYLLRRGKFLREHGDSKLVVWLKARYRPTLEFAVNHPKKVIAGAALAFAVAMLPFLFLGRSFLPTFNEGSLTVLVATAPGTSLEKSAQIGGMVEHILKQHPNIVKTSRKTGRGELDEHGKPPSASEIEARVDVKDRNPADILAELREAVKVVPGTIITFGQPISHRIDHMLSGTTANLAVKVYGPELFRLRAIAEDVRSEMSGVHGIADLSVEQQVDVSQIRIIPRRSEIARYGMSITQVAEAAETAMTGKVVSRTLEGDRGFDIMVKYDEGVVRNFDSIRAVLVDTPTGAKVPLYELADVVSGKGPNGITRENVQRKIVVQANVAGRDLRGVFDDVKGGVEKNLKLPSGYYIEYGGQFQSEAEASRMISLLSILSLAAILLILYMEFGSFRAAALVMVNLPLSIIGGVLIILVTDRIISIASIVGFITLFGIATRNGILLVAHYRNLMEEGLPLRDAVVRGSMERLRPVIMTALAAGLALLPFTFAADKPGNEILAPIAAVILGGLLSSTALNMVVLPSLYMKYGVSKKEEE
ncbi:MAG TPA: efflux RND transporter permease subunit [Dissulfurispiraceae bacterium]|nr:efflux RND transporter permease subunit [Dissulfurispiraceae bacterium]